MEVMVTHCCGLDVHQKSITACVLVGKLTSSRPKKTQKHLAQQLLTYGLFPNG